MFIREIWGKLIWGKVPRSFFEILKSPSSHSGDFKISKSELGKFIPNFPIKHVITSTDRYFW